MSRRDARRMVAVVTVLGVFALSAGGCYRKVVSATGLGADQVEIEQPYQQTGPVDRWIFGSDPTRKPETAIKQSPR